MKEVIPPHTCGEVSYVLWQFGDPKCWRMTELLTFCPGQQGQQSGRGGKASSATQQTRLESEDVQLRCFTGRAVPKASETPKPSDPDKGSVFWAAFAKLKAKAEAAS